MKQFRENFWVDSRKKKSERTSEYIQCIFLEAFLEEFLKNKRLEKEILEKKSIYELLLDELLDELSEEHFGKLLEKHWASFMKRNFGEN